MFGTLYFGTALTPLMRCSLLHARRGAAGRLLRGLRPARRRRPLLPRHGHDGALLLLAQGERARHQPQLLRARHVHRQRAGSRLGHHLAGHRGPAHPGRECMHACGGPCTRGGRPSKPPSWRSRQAKNVSLFLQRTLKQWRDVFWVTFGVCLFSSVVYCVFSSAEVQPWNSVGEGGEFLEDAAHPAAASTPEKEKRRASEAAKV